MRFEALSIPGAFSVEIARNDDARGFFARLWCREQFAAHGIAVEMVQASISYNHAAGTLRGMHYAVEPSREGKLVRCQRGSIHDVLLDLRTASPAYLRHVAVVLDASRHNAVYIPPGVAHGFQTLADDSEVLYMMTDVYRPELAAGVRYDDAAFGIRWPLPVSVIAERDRTYVDYAPGAV